MNLPREFIAVFQHSSAHHLEEEVNQWLQDYPTLRPKEYKLSTLVLDNSVYITLVIPYEEIN